MECMVSSGLERNVGYSWIVRRVIYVSHATFISRGERCMGCLAMLTTNHDND